MHTHTWHMLAHTHTHTHTQAHTHTHTHKHTHTHTHTHRVTTPTSSWRAPKRVLYLPGRPTNLPDTLLHDRVVWIQNASLVLQTSQLSHSSHSPFSHNNVPHWNISDRKSVHGTSKFNLWHANFRDPPPQKIKWTKKNLKEKSKEINSTHNHSVSVMSRNMHWRCNRKENQIVFGQDFSSKKWN